MVSGVDCAGSCMALLFGRPQAAQSQSALGQTRNMFILYDDQLEILSVPLRVGKLIQNQEGIDVSHQGQLVVSLNSKLVLHLFHPHP